MNSFKKTIACALLITLSSQHLTAWPWGSSFSSTNSHKGFIAVLALGLGLFCGLNYWYDTGNNKQEPSPKPTESQAALPIKTKPYSQEELEQVIAVFERQAENDRNALATAGTIINEKNQQLELLKQNNNAQKDLAILNTTLDKSLQQIERRRQQEKDQQRERFSRIRELHRKRAKAQAVQQYNRRQPIFDQLAQGNAPQATRQQVRDKRRERVQHIRELHTINAQALAIVASAQDMQRKNAQQLQQIEQSQLSTQEYLANFNNSQKVANPDAPLRGTSNAEQKTQSEHGFDNNSQEPLTVDAYIQKINSLTVQIDGLKNAQYSHQDIVALMQKVSQFRESLPRSLIANSQNTKLVTALKELSIKAQELNYLLRSLTHTISHATTNGHHEKPECKYPDNRNNNNSLNGDFHETF